MSVADIIGAIEAETAVEIERRLGEAQLRADQVVEQARTDVRARVEAAVARAEPAIRAEAARRTNAARLRLRERRAEVALTRTTAIHAAARAQLAAIAGGAEPERWAGSLHGLLEEALALVGPEATVQVRVRDAGFVAACVQAAGGRLEPLADDAPAGVVARSSDGRIEVDATIQVRLDRAHVRLAEWLAGQLGLGA
jgi:vacuolar-type H+-ATPase subunit E/Vma4